MIHRTFSTLPSFKAMKFRPGMNIVLADKSPGATDRQTRNRAGKTSLIELIHFLTGANCEPESIFRDKELLEHSFGLDLDVGGQRVSVERSGSEPSKLDVSGETVHWPIQPRLQKNTGRLLISNVPWKDVLAALVFGVNDNEDDQKKYAPTFRSLFAYFVRRQAAGAFLEPVRQASEQLTWDQQVAVSFLIGFDWTIPQAWQRLRDREESAEHAETRGKGRCFW